MEMHTENLTKRWLEAEFRKKRQSNPAYSLRAFARQLELPPGRLSEFLSGKRKVSARQAAKLSQRLGLSPNQSKSLFQASAASREESHLLLEEDTFQLIANWEHTALLSLIDTNGFRADPRWIGKRLGISSVEAREALERLERVGLITKVGGSYQRSNTELKTTNEISSASLRLSHRQSLEQAIEALENVPLTERDITSITMAIDPARLPLAKTLIREFRFRLAELLESGAKKEVYNLNVQLVPVSKKEKT